MNYTQSQIDLANETNLVAFLSAQGEELIKSGKEYRWKAHDSVCINNNQWFQHSQNKGGYPVDFVMNFYGLSFSDAVETLLNMKGVFMTEDNKTNNTNEQVDVLTSTEEFFEIPVDYDELEKKEFALPPAAENNDIMRDYLINKRGIDEFTVNAFETLKFIYEDADYHNAVFVGYDRMSSKDAVPKYASKRSTTDKFRTDVAGSDKSYGFWLTQESSDQLMVFESPIDMMSFISLYYKGNNWPNCVALGGVSPKAMERILKENNNIRNVFLCLDNDEAGNNACERIANEIKERYSVTRVRPTKKDWNDVLVEHNINPDFDIRAEKISLSKHCKVPMLYMKDIEIETIKWLWENYVPVGKVTIIQGEGGVGKTTLTAEIAGFLSSGKLLPGSEEAIEPINIIIQSAEDGYGDTIKPRLLVAGADMDRIMVIDEKDYPLTLNDDRIFRAIKENNVKLAIFDPLQAYLGDADMNRANEMRNIFKVLCRIAEETGCAVILIGHLNKNVSAGVQQRSLGSSDITNAVRNVLTVVKINNDDERRLMCQTKNNLAPLAKSVEFVLDKETGFRFVGISDMKYEDAVSLKSKSFDEDDENYETKQELAERKIIEYLTDNGATESDTVKSFVMSFGIGEKTYNNARSSLKEKGITKVYKGSNSWMIELAKR